MLIGYNSPAVNGNLYEYGTSYLIPVKRKFTYFRVVFFFFLLPCKLLLIGRYTTIIFNILRVNGINEILSTRKYIT